MTSSYNDESGDDYAAIIVQKRSSLDLNRGYWIGRSYHTTWGSLKARYLGITGLLCVEPDGSSDV